MAMIKLDYERHPRLPPTPPAPPSTPRPKRWRKYPAWLGYTTAYVSAVYILCYLGLVLSYSLGSDPRPQTSVEAGEFATVIAGLCMGWSGHLFYIGVLMMLDDRAAHERVPIWCAVQLVLAVLLATACGYERYFSANNRELAEEASTIALLVGILSAAYAAILLFIRAGQNPLGRV